MSVCIWVTQYMAFLYLAALKALLCHLSIHPCVSYCHHAAEREETKMKTALGTIKEIKKGHALPHHKLLPTKNLSVTWKTSGNIVFPSLSSLNRES